MSQNQFLNFIPKNSHSYVKKIVAYDKIEIRVVKNRKSKHGDFRLLKSGQNLITINATKNPFRFLITLIHELAHFRVSKNFSYRVLPHGKEWKATFKTMILPLLNNNVFPENILSRLAKHMKNPRATTDSDEDLIIYLSKYDLNRDDNLNKREKSDLEFAIGKAYDDQKNYELSIKYFESANKLRKELTDYNFKSDEKLFQSIKNYFEKININNNKNNKNSKKIIFIVGLPRSGTTLLEQILSSHNEVFGAGELDFLRKIINQYFVQDNKLLPQKINEHQLSTDTIVNDKYFNYLKNLDNNSMVTIDKSPQNFIWIGFIKLFFKNAKIIHSKRNLKDTFLSNFKNNFASKDMDWTYDPSDIIKYFHLYDNYMKFWKKLCGDFIYDIDYENVVSNSEDQIRKILNFCELDWDENCLNHHKNKKTMIKTVSTFQARKPIYTTSVDSNKFYSKNLERYFKQLDHK